MADRISLRRLPSSGLHRLWCGMFGLCLGFLLPVLLRGPINALSWAIVLNLPPWLSGPLLLMLPLVWFLAVLAVLMLGIKNVSERQKQPRRIFSRR